MEMHNRPPVASTVEGIKQELSPPRGYPQLATFMEMHPEMTMVRRFQGLNTRNLLYLQAELADIENRLLKCEREDAADIPNRRSKYSTDFFKLKRDGDKQESDQWDLIIEMRAKLKEYS